MEDSAAVFGLFIAGAGVYMTYMTGNPMWDSVGAMSIGALLAAVAIFLVRRNMNALVGRFDTFNKSYIAFCAVIFRFVSFRFVLTLFFRFDRAISADQEQRILHTMQSDSVIRSVQSVKAVALV